MTKMKYIIKIIILISKALIALLLFNLIVGLILPIELAEYKHRELFYMLALPGFPIATLLTLFSTIKRENTKAQNLYYAGCTILISLAAFMFVIALLFAGGLGAWRTASVIYKHKQINTEIREQWLDIGALGYGGKRIIQVRPVLKYWNFVRTIDTSTLDQSEWNLVNEPGDIVQ
jgi:hypothetical protein